MGIKSLNSFIVLFFAVTACFAQTTDKETFEKINSVYDEQSPVISADGKTMYITLSHHPQNIGGLKDLGDIWISTTNGIQWSEPVHGGTLINDKGYNAVAGVLENGNQLMLLHHVSKETGTAKQGISVSSFENNQWQKPINISIPYFHSRSSNISGHISENGNYLVYAADTYGTFGVEDIYVTQKVNGNWTEPKNLGSNINTVFQEITPSLNSAADTLYFSSNGRKGLGSFDIYASARLDDSWTKWSEPINISTVNTQGRELFYKSLGNGRALYTSTRNSDGYGDLKQLGSNDQSVDTTTFVVVNTEKGTAISDKIKITGKIQNAKTGENINAQLRFTSAIERIEGKGTDKGYEVLLSAVDDYKVSIEAKGYISTLETINLNTFQAKNIELDFKLQPIEVGTTVNLKSILFKQSSTDLLPGSNEELDIVAAFMLSNPKVKIELAGHTDNRGVQKDNVKLSQARTQKVKDYLVKKGISGKRISGKGYGGAKPIANNDSEESRKLNRRVEFTIVSN